MPNFDRYTTHDLEHMLTNEKNALRIYKENVSYYAKADFRAECATTAIMVKECEKTIKAIRAAIEGK